MSSVRTMLLCYILLMLCMEQALADHQVVLVASSTSPLHELDSLEIRKIYLGFNVRRDGKTVKALLNTEDKNLYSIFLQTVVAMSEKSYTNRLLSLTINQGTPRPAEYDETENLLNALVTKPYSVSYMWQDDAVRSSKVKILRVLWHRN